MSCGAAMCRSGVQGSCLRFASVTIARRALLRSCFVRSFPEHWREQKSDPWKSLRYVRPQVSSWQVSSYRPGLDLRSNAWHRLEQNR